MNIKDIEETTLSKNWAVLKRVDFDYWFKNGKWKRISREVYDRGDGAAILLFNSQSQTVILTKQFRMPIYQNNPDEACSLEVCAGAIDKGDSPLETILREVEEETGYKLSSAQQVMSAYTSPGAVTEKMFLFIAQYNSSLKVNEGGGVVAENEELEVIEMPFSKALAMVKTGEIQDTKTILLLQYAQIENLI